jgi:hypothetical protein
LGVHIRRGDYKKWQHGKYYFNDETYRKCMNAFSQKLSENNAKKTVIVIFSNEKVDFTETPSLMISKESWFIDHLIMSLCDCLIGPPSTFTLWANYIGKNTLFYIKNEEGEMENATLGAHGNDVFHVISPVPRISPES